MCVCANGRTLLYAPRLCFSAITNPLTDPQASPAIRYELIIFAWAKMPLLDPIPVVYVHSPPPPVHFPWVFLFIWHSHTRYYHTNSQMLPWLEHVVKAGFIPARKLSHWATWKKPLTWQGSLTQRWSGVSSQHLMSPAHISGGQLWISTWLQLMWEMWIKEFGGYGGGICGGILYVP